MFKKSDLVRLKRNIDIRNEEFRGGYYLKQNFIIKGSLGKIIAKIDPLLSPISRDPKYEWFIVTFEEDDIATFEKGYVHITLPDYLLSPYNKVEAKSKIEEVGITSRGYTIFRHESPAGGYVYWSDEIGGGVIVYDSMIDPESVILALKAEGVVDLPAITQRELIYWIAGRKGTPK